MAWNLACPDWEQRLREGRPLVPKLPLWDDQAERAVAVLKKLRLYDVPGTPTMAEAGGEWFFDVVRALFGSVHPETRQRMIRELLLLVPKKNNKTTGSALLMLTALLLNVRPRAKFLLLGPTQDAAELAFAAAKGAIDLDDVLTAKLHAREHLKRIEHRRTGAALEIMSFDPAVLTGQKPAGMLIDELHECAKMNKAASALRQLRGGMVAYPESFLVMITTQSEEPPRGVFREELIQARQIRDGAKRGDLLPVLYEFPEAMQRDESVWMDPTNWHMVNPNWGRSIDAARLRELYAKEVDKGPAGVRAWASQHLNVEVGVALHTDRWAGAVYWERRTDPTLDLQEILRRSDVVTVGIDGGGQDDLLALAVLGRERDTRRWLLWVRAWAHVDLLELRKAEASRLLGFVDDGDLVLVEDLVAANAELAAVVQEVDASGLLSQVALDVYGPTDAQDALADVGIEGEEKVVGVRTGWMLNGATKTMETRLASGTLVHASQPLMSWCVGNAKVVVAGNAITITKQAAGLAKIDPLIAAFCASALMVRNPQPAGRSIYADASAWAEADAAPEEAPDPAILADPRHPEWDKHRRLYEAQLELTEHDD